MSPSSNLSQIIKLAPGEIITAQVLKAEIAAPQIKLQLQVQLQKQLSALIKASQLGAQKPSDTPTDLTRPQIQQSLKLLQSPQLILAKLQVKQQQQFIYTNQPVQRGDKVNVQMQANGRLSLLPSNITQPTHTADSKAVIQQALRQAMPLQQPANLLLNTLKTIQNSVQAQQLLPKTLQQSLQLIQHSAKSPNQLSSPTTLQQTLNNSGPMLEGKIAKALQQQTVDPANSGKFNLPQAEASRTDLKALLATAIKLTTQLAPTTNSANPASTVTAAANNAASGQLISPQVLLQQLLPQAQQSTGRTELSPKDLKIQLVQLLHQQLLGSMARVQQRQLQSVISSNEGGGQATSIQLEIPIRWGDSIHNLELQIEEKEQKNDRQDNRSNEKEWQVTLSFDLGEYGSFHARLKVVDDHVSAKLWAEQPRLFSALEREINGLQQQLESQGLVVDQLQCHPGQPSLTSNKLSYQLVDIKT